MVTLPAEVVELLRDPSTVKVLATTDELGTPHAVLKGTLSVLKDGYIAYAEMLESSLTNSNMLRSLWFDKTVAILIRGDNDRSYRIIGRPYRYAINGPIFKAFCLTERERQGPDSEVAGVWLIDPEDVRTETFAVRKAEEDDKHPYTRHLDRIAYWRAGQDCGVQPS